MNQPAGPLSFALAIAEKLDHLGVPYVLGGSVASSFFGEPRTTIEVDFAVQLAHRSLDRLVDAWNLDFYIPENAANNAVTNHTSFNVLHHATGVKVDLFVLGDRPLDRHQFERRIRVVVQTDPVRSIWVTAPEDLILRKLDWYRLGGQVSDRQWRDVQGMLGAQSDYLDFDHIRRVAVETDLTELFDAALSAANHGS
jgi:hypothetical protein